MSLAHAAAPAFDEIEAVVADARERLSGTQERDGHFVFELEADATIPSEYVLLRHFLGEPDPESEAPIAAYLRAAQGAHGGWALFHDGDLDISASVKAYFALKVIGDDPDAPHMARAREAILAAGGAARANVFTRILLALFGEVPWRAVPVMPVEIMLLPRWFPFHLAKISYWSRTVIVPLLVLMARKPLAANPRDVHVRELFTVPPEEERHYNVNPTGSRIGNAFLVLDRLLRAAEPLIPKGLRARAERRALDFIEPRLNGEDGLGAIYPAMANVVMMYHVLGVPADDPRVATARRAIEKLRYRAGEELDYVQPCVSPIWDTCLATHALLEAGEDGDGPRARQATDWLAERQITDAPGDWRWRRPDLEGGGWAFQYANDHYPDVDDTAAVAMALHRADPKRHAAAIERARVWVAGMQSENGGWGAFDVDNTAHYLNHIPFADHGALLDPPTADVSARCVGFLAQLGYGKDDPVVARGLDYLRREQEADGSWYGRWGANYVYGTWSALHAFNAAGEDMGAPPIRKAVAWLESRQRADGGWGEDCATYWQHRRAEVKESTASQTAWAVLGLMAAGEVESEAVARGVAWLARAPREGARWREDHYTGVGFPRVFYLRYHGYAAYFPLWALARYRNLMRSNDRRVAHGL
ncbi:MAG: squalene--hopene cyclase [Azospirillaceae bacterium]